MPVLDLSPQQLPIYRTLLRLWQRMRAIEADPTHPDRPRPVFKKAAKLPQAALDDCRLLADREALLDHLPKQAVCAEIGTQEGRFADAIRRIARPREFHIVDIDLSQLQSASALAADPAVVLHEQNSAACLGEFPDRYFDWIYIDADHSYPAVRRDADIALRKIKEDGYLVFNDYIFWSHEQMLPYGVVTAVNEICIEHDLSFVYFALHRSMYCDVALRRRSTLGGG